MRSRGRTLPLVASVALSLMLGLGSSCGGGSGSPHETPPRYAVVQRDFAWEAAPDDESHPAVPLTQLWDFEADDHSWQVPLRAGRAETWDGVLRASGEMTASGKAERVDIVGPRTDLVEAELHHWLSLRMRTTSARTLQLFWHAEGEIFSSDRSTSPMRLDDSGEWATYSVSMAGLRGVREAADAAEGVRRFRLRFGGPDGRPVQVEIDRIVLLSDYDDPGGRSFTEGRLLRGGIARDGVALRTPGAVTATLPAGGPGRLRMSLAVAGTDQAVSLVVADLDGLIQPARFDVPPYARWKEVRLDLPSRSSPLRLTVRAERPAGSRAVVLVGSVMRLALAEQPGPSVILYVEDTLRADHLSTYGYARPTDPFLSELAGEGATFTHVWSTSNWTRPSISSLLTSLDPVAHGNQVHTRRVPEALTTLAETLGEAGWITASFVTNYHAGAWAGLEQGFDIAAEPWAYGATRIESTLTSSALTEPLAAFLAEHADEQVLVFAHSLDPHAPYAPEPEDVQAVSSIAARIEPPERLKDKDFTRWRQTTRDYDAEVLHNDRELAALDAALLRLGLKDDTIFVFASDHGESFGTRGRWEHRQDLHEDQVRVPWVLRWPGEVAAGRRIDAPVSLLDLAPTLLGLLDVAAPDAWQGRDLSAQLRDDGAQPVRPAPLYLDAVYGDDRPDKTHEFAVVNWPYKLLGSVRQDGGLRPVALFDLVRDPGELANLLGLADHAQALAGLLDVARERIDAGPLAPRAGADAAPMDPAVLEWMKQMGYLR